MAANDAFNDSTLTFGDTLAGIDNISASESAAAVQVSGSDAEQKEYVAGIPDLTITVTIKGGTTIEVGEVKALTLAWNSVAGPSHGTLASAVCVDKSMEGSEDAPITTTLTFRPSAESSTG